MPTVQNPLSDKLKEAIAEYTQGQKTSIDDTYKRQTSLAARDARENSHNAIAPLITLSRDQFDTEGLIASLRVLQSREPPRGKPRGITSGVARVQAALAPYLLPPDAQYSAG